MKDLLKDYNKTRRETIKKLNNLEEKYQNITKTKNKLFTSKIEDPSTDEVQVLQEIEIVREMLSSINYVIQWLRTGSQPNQKRGIERRAAYERELPFEPYWIQRQKEQGEFGLYELSTIENEELIANNLEQKERTISAITKSLTKRQKEILELAGNGFSYEEIAKLLKVHKGTISQTLNRAKEKIREEGWFMP